MYDGPVAQLVRAPPCHGGGRGFESLLGRWRKVLWVLSCLAVRGLSSAGRASALQAEGHRFEPYRPQEAGVAELADAQDLKSCGPNRPYRFDSGRRHKKTSRDAGFFVLHIFRRTLIDLLVPVFPIPIPQPGLSISE